MKLSNLVSRLEEIAPPDLADEFDAGRIGLIVKGRGDVTKVATALDPTPYAIQRAVDEGAQMLVTHHTLIWDPVNSIDEDLAARLKLLLDNDVSLYSMHTNYDNAPGGVNDVLAGLIGLAGPELFSGGRAGNVPETRLHAFAEEVSKKLGCGVEYVGDDERRIKKAALVAGSGFRLALDTARAARVDVLLSSELKHDVILGRGSVALVSAPHYFTEAPAMKALAERLGHLVPAVYIDDPPHIKTIHQDGRRI